MIIPIRCFSCGKPISHLWETYQERVEKGENRKKVLDDIGLRRACCRSAMMTHVELIEDAAKFKVF